MEPLELPPPSFSWKYRRTFMFLISAFCCFVIIYVLMKENDTDIGSTAIIMSFILLGGIVGSYVFGATWEDLSRMKKWGG